MCCLEFYEYMMLFDFIYFYDLFTKNTASASLCLPSALPRIFETKSPAATQLQPPVVLEHGSDLMGKQAFSIAGRRAIPASIDLHE